MPKVILGRGVHARPLSLRGFFSVYICQPSIAGMPKFRLLAHSDSMLSHTREADEEFKKNS